MNRQPRVATLTFASPEYIARYRVHRESVERFLPQATPVLRTLDELVAKYTSRYSKYLSKAGPFLAAVRPQAVLDLFDEGFDTVVQLGADVVFYSDASSLLEMGADVVVTPHLLSPLPDDGKFPSNETVAHAGHVNSDITVFRDRPAVRQFLEWQARVHESKCVEDKYTLYDQTWLNFVPFFVQRTHILFDDRYNVAYWNYVERNLRRVDGIWYTNDGPLVAFHFSGLDPRKPEHISRHQNRHKASGEFLEFIKSYLAAVTSHSETQQK